MAEPFLTQLTPEPIDVGDLTAYLHEGGAGGVCLFLGTTRGDAVEGRKVVALDYEAYLEMAETQLESLARRAADRWPVRRCVLIHRTGRVPVGEASVLIGVACPHRVEAFEACRWLIDTLKAELAVWKKDIYDDGSEEWTPANREAFRGIEGPSA